MGSHTGYAFYMKGLAAFTDDSGLFSRYFQSDLAKREVVMAQTSFDELSDFISRYPSSKYVPHAKQRMIYLRNLLAEHEIYVADFYMKRGAYLAAIGRAKYVIEHLPNTPQTQKQFQHQPSREQVSQTIHGQLIQNNMNFRMQLK